MAVLYLEVYQNQGYHFGGPNNKDCSILGSMSGSLYFGKRLFAPLLGPPYPTIHPLQDYGSPGFGFKV